LSTTLPLRCLLFLATALVPTLVVEHMANYAVQPGERRWIQGVNANTGQEAFTVAPAGGGVWTMVYADGLLRVVRAGNWRRVTKTPTADVVYERFVAGFLTPPALLESIRAESDAAIQLWNDGQLELEVVVCPTVFVPNFGAGQGAVGAAPRRRNAVIHQLMRAPTALWKATTVFSDHLVVRAGALLLMVMGGARGTQSAGRKLGLFSLLSAVTTSSVETLEWVEQVRTDVKERFEAVKTYLAMDSDDLWDFCWIGLGVAILLGMWFTKSGPPAAAPPAAAFAPAPRPPNPPGPRPAQRQTSFADDQVIQDLLAEQRKLTRTVLDLQSQLASGSPGDAAAGAFVAGATDPRRDEVPEASPSLGYEKMIERLDKMEAMMRADSGRTTGVAATLPGLPGPVVGSAGAVENAGAVEDLIMELERASTQVHGAFLRQLRRYRDVSPWPMPSGFRSRLAAPYLSQVYRNGTAGVQYAQRWIQTHGLERCVPAQELLSIMEAVDDAITVDEKDVINSVSFEKLCRRAYGLERAYEDCAKESDWRRPENSKSWKTKVKWDLCDRYDLRGMSQRGTRIPLADKEARGEMETEAAFNKYYQKVTESAAARD
jgi:hypothetical protein